MINGLVALMQADVQSPVNVGNPEEISIFELAELVIDQTGGSSGIEYGSRPPHDPAVRKPDITKAKEELGWSPEIDLEDGLRRTVEYFETIV